MPVEVSVGKKDYESTNKYHGEELALAAHPVGNITVNMNAWPCTGERGHDCHALFKKKSAGRTITVVINADHAGYAANHGRAFGATGTITYTKGVAVYS